MEDDQFADDLPTFMVQKKGKKKTKQIRNEDDDEDIETTNTPATVSQSLKVVTLLRQKSLDYVVKQYNLNCKQHSKYANLRQLTYSQLESPMGSPIVQECRGLVRTHFPAILTPSDPRPVEQLERSRLPISQIFQLQRASCKSNWLVNRDRHGKTWRYSTPLKSHNFTGSIMTLYWYDNAWHVSSSSLPDASGRVGTLQTNREDGSQVCSHNKFYH